MGLEWEKLLEHGGPKGLMNSAEVAKESEPLRKKMERLVFSFTEANRMDDFYGFNDRQVDLAKQIREKHPEDYELYATYHVLAGGTVPPDIKAIDFPESELSVKNFIDAEYKREFPEEDKQEK